MKPEIERDLIVGLQKKPIFCLGMLFTLEGYYYTVKPPSEGAEKGYKNIWTSIGRFEGRKVTFAKLVSLACFSASCFKMQRERERKTTQKLETKCLPWLPFGTDFHCGREGNRLNCAVKETPKSVI